jgi:hypothetical protein
MAQSEKFKEIMKSEEVIKYSIAGKTRAILEAKLL